MGSSRAQEESAARHRRPSSGARAAGRASPPDGPPLGRPRVSARAEIARRARRRRPPLPTLGAGTKVAAPISGSRYRMEGPANGLACKQPPDPLPDSDAQCLPVRPSACLLIPLNLELKQHASALAPVAKWPTPSLGGERPLARV